MLTSQVPLLEGVGQQLTFQKREQGSSRDVMWQYAGVLTGERDITFVLTRVPPLQYCKWLVDGKFTRWVLERYVSFFVRGKLPDVRVLFKLKFRSKCGGRRHEGEFDPGERWV